MSAVQQTTSRWRASANAVWLPSLSTGAACVAGYRVITDAPAGAGRDDVEGAGSRPLGPRPFVAAASRGAASRLDDDGREAEASADASSARATGSPCGARASSRSRAASLLTLDTQRVGRRSILTAVGEVDVSTSADLQRALQTAYDGAAEIWLDLTHTTFMDCSGLGVLLHMRAIVREANRRLVLICPAGPVLRLLTLTGTDREFDVHPTRSAAESADCAERNEDGGHR